MTIKTIYDQTLLALNITITTEQEMPIFNLICRKFFSNVQPIIDEVATKIEFPYDEVVLSSTYLDAFQTVCEMILERFESYNMQTLKGLGVNDIDTKIDISYQDIDEYLFKKFAMQSPTLTIS